MNGTALEFLKKGGDSDIDWLVRIFNVSITQGALPDNLQNPCVVPLYSYKDSASNKIEYVC